ncbi:MAG: cyclic-di-AMP receptor [Fimbriimonadaceae bacterium]|nr:cyclic-di-AMP receptor [Fimbriimonadaceae bacterium]
MKLAICIVHNRDRNRLHDRLVEAGFKFTVIGSTGGFLREGNTTVLIGFEAEQKEALSEIVSGACCSREQMVTVAPFESGPSAGIPPTAVNVPVGGAVVFFLNVDEFQRF